MSDPVIVPLVACFMEMVERELRLGLDRSLELVHYQDFVIVVQPPLHQGRLLFRVWENKDASLCLRVARDGGHVWFSGPIPFEDPDLEGWVSLVIRERLYPDGAWLME